MSEQDHALPRAMACSRYCVPRLAPARTVVQSPPGHGGLNKPMPSAAKCSSSRPNFDPPSIWETQGQIDGGDATAATYDLASPTADLLASEQLPVERQRGHSFIAPNPSQTGQ